MAKVYQYVLVGALLLLIANVVFFMGFNGDFPSPSRLIDQQSKVICTEQSRIQSASLPILDEEWIEDSAHTAQKNPYRNVHTSDTTNFKLVRPSQKKFTSKAVEKAIIEISSNLVDKQLAILFQNCLPNTLDTTVIFREQHGPLNELDSFVITGDIEALWLRDSTNQVWPYLRFAGEDSHLSDMIKGLINRQVRSVLIDPYANAFHDDSNNMAGHYDRTEKKPGVFERKYELDSLASVVRLSVGFYEATGDISVFDDRWISAMDLILDTIVENQKPDSKAYSFLRNTDQPSETLLHGRGNPVRYCGLSKSPFRPSDDATILPFLVPANAMAATWINKLVTLNLLSSNAKVEKKAKQVVESIQRGINLYGIVHHPHYGRVYAYEVDGFGGHYLSDDANVPSLISLPYLQVCSLEDPIYQATRKMLLSPDNPWYFQGTAATGIGSPHGNGPDWIWPMSIIMRALTSNNDTEIMECLKMLKRSSADTGFMHESFHKDDPKQFTRCWFAWYGVVIF